METVEVMQAVEAWAVEVTNGELNSYPVAPPEIGQAMPLVIAEPQDDRVTVAGAKYQQTLLRQWVVSLRILTNPDDAWTATQELAGFVDQLGAALRAPSKTMGERVEAALPTYAADYDPPEVEFQDGTRARQVTMTITVGEQTGGV